jgi:hypothetical protein
VAASRGRAVQRLFFGGFLLAPQKKTEGFAKVTPPPGGTPGTLPPSKRRLDNQAVGKANRQSE